MTAPLRRLLNKYEEGETRFQTLLRMMDSRTYPTPHDPKRKMHLTEGTKDEAETKQNNIIQAKTEEVERVNQAEPVDGILNIAILEKKTQGSFRKNIDTRLYNKGARHTRYLQAETEDDKYEAETKQDDTEGINNPRQCQAETEGAKYQATTETVIFQAETVSVKNHEAGEKQTDLHQAKTEDTEYQAKDKGGVKNHEGEDIQVKSALIADLPPALSLGVLKDVAEQGEGYQKLKEAEKADKKPKDRDMGPYKAVGEDQAKAKGDIRNEGISVKNHDYIQAETKGNGVKDYEKQNDVPQAKTRGERQNDVSQAETEGNGSKNHDFPQAKTKVIGIKDYERQSDSLQAKAGGEKQNQAKAKGGVKNEGIGVDINQPETRGIGDKNHNHLHAKTKAENKAETKGTGVKDCKKQSDSLQAETGGEEQNQAKAKGGVKNEGIGVDFHQAETRGIGDKNHDNLQAKTKGGTKAENKAKTKGTGVKDSEKQSDSLQAETGGTTRPRPRAASRARASASTSTRPRPRPRPRATRTSRPRPGPRARGEGGGGEGDRGDGEAGGCLLSLSIIDVIIADQYR